MFPFAPKFKFYIFLYLYFLLITSLQSFLVSWQYFLSVQVNNFDIGDFPKEDEDMDLGNINNLNVPPIERITRPIELR